ncbi:DNA break repair nuclease [Linnemannia exigua]|uniref:DNA break repair nuclease n=1 Tax=Linnemannia exigua TaxID=604196 RepID=A0AAD4H7Z5_9FUNG|nr:DNA break repair nuclease [Linnemannia exigua]
MNNSTSDQRKHDLVDAPSHSRQLSNVTDQPLTKKKRTFSLKRPSSPSLAHSVTTTTNTVSTSLHTTQHTTSAAPAGAIVKKDNADTTTCLTPFNPVPQKDSSATWHRSGTERGILAIPDCNSQKGVALQKNWSSTTTVTVATTTTAATTATVTTTEPIVQRLDSEEEEDLNDFETLVFPATSTSKTCQNIKTPPTTDELAFQGAGGSSAIDNDNSRDNDDESIIDATNLTEYPMHGPDCDETPIDNDDFDVDEIQDWDSFEDIATPVDPVPENACPVCGVNLSSLDTMTPAAHVNRCLDGSLTEQEQEQPSITTTTTTTTATTASIVAMEPLTSRNPLSNIIGTIRSVISHIPSYPLPSSSSSSNKKEPPSKQPNGKKAGGNFKPKPPRPCPFYKKMPDTGFTVDAFCYGKVEGCDAYFLSHFHSDHYGGLTSNWNHGPIYCSSITANLVISRLRVDEQYVKRLPMYVPTVVGGVTVRLMDANHCPGSVLFVFDLHNPKRRYLHTGDFRASPDMVIDPILCQPQNVPIDILYLDTTYSNPRYTFPPQDVVIQETARLICKELGVQADQPSVAAVPVAPVVKITKRVNLMESWLKMESGNSEKLMSMSIRTSQIAKSKQAWKEPAEKNKIVICVGTYLIGKERVFKAIAKAINSKVYVQPSKLQILQCLEDSELTDMLTSDRHEAQVHLLHMGSDMSPEALQDYLDSLSPTFARLIAVRPTGWTFTGTKKFTPANDNGPMDTSTTISPAKPATSVDLRPSYTSATVKIYPVPYSEHSSFSELAGFVRSLNIHKVIPTVGVGSEKGRHAMNEWFKRWEQERRQGIGWD